MKNNEKKGMELDEDLMIGGSGGGGGGGGGVVQNKVVLEKRGNFGVF